MLVSSRLMQVLPFFLGNGMLAGLKVRRNSIFVGQTGRRKSKFVVNIREKAGSSEGAQ